MIDADKLQAPNGKAHGQPRDNWLPALAAGFSRRLRMAMAALGQAADEIGCRLDGLSRMELGKATSLSVPTIEGISRWAVKRGISLVWLFTGEGEMRPDPNNHDAISEDDLRLLNVMKAAKGVTITIPYDQEATS